MQLSFKHMFTRKQTRFNISRFQQVWLLLHNVDIRLDLLMFFWSVQTTHDTFCNHKYLKPFDNSQQTFCNDNINLALYVNDFKNKLCHMLYVNYRLEYLSSDVFFKGQISLKCKPVIIIRNVQQKLA